MTWVTPEEDKYGLQLIVLQKGEAEISAQEEEGAPEGHESPERIKLSGDGSIQPSASSSQQPRRGI